MKLFLLTLLIFVTALSADNRNKVIKAFTDKYCIDCHDTDIQKGGLDLSAHPLSLNSVDSQNMWTYSLDRTLQKEMPPAKKKKQPSAKEIKVFTDALTSLLNEKISSSNKLTGRTVLRRLTREEYENTLQDLLYSPELKIKHLLPEDPSSEGFDNVSEAQELSRINIKKYLEAADFALNKATFTGSKPTLINYQVKPRNFRHYSKSPKSKDVLYLTYKDRDAGNFPPHFENLKIEHSGYYKVSIRAYSCDYDLKAKKALPNSKNQVLSLYSGFGRQLTQDAVFSLPENNCREYLTYTTYLEPNDKIVFRPSSLLTQPKKDLTGTVNSVAFTDVKVEGPFFEEWPPKSHKHLYAGLKQKAWNSKISRIATPEVSLNKNSSADTSMPVIVSDNPQKDSRFLIKRFINRAFRRPVSQLEVKKYTDLFDSKIQQGFNFHYSLKTVYKTILCSPDFLYFNENLGRLNDFSLASRLSYFLWKSMPDNTLFSLAAQKKLRHSDVLTEQVNRMLNDKKSARFIKSFVDQWLDLKNFNATSPDLDLYPEYDSEDWLLQSMQKESYAFFRELIDSNLPLKNIIESDFVMINEKLADLYGLKNIKGDQIRKYKLPSNSARGGFLTQGSILKVTANGMSTSPVNRGVWMAERLLGLHIPPPPPNVDGIDPDTQNAQSIRQVLEKHREEPSCAACHSKIDPIGFALEGFDVMGAQREHYRSMNDGKDVKVLVNNDQVKYKLGQKIDDSGSFPGKGHFGSIKEFKELINKNNEKILYNFLEKLIAFSTGSAVQFPDRIQVQEIVLKHKNNNGLKTLIHALVQSRIFRSK